MVSLDTSSPPSVLRSSKRYSPFVRPALTLATSALSGATFSATRVPGGRASQAKKSKRRNHHKPTATRRARAAAEAPRILARRVVIRLPSRLTDRASATGALQRSLYSTRIEANRRELDADAHDGRPLHLASLQEPSALEYRGHRLFDSRRPRRRLLGRGKVVQVTPLPPRRQRLEGALETRVASELLAQFLGNRKI